MRRLASAALLFACACASAPPSQAPPPVRRHIVVVTCDAVLVDFVAAHGSEPIDQITLNMGRNSNLKQAPVDFAPLALLKSVQTLSLSGFTVPAEPQGLTMSPGLTDAQVLNIGQIRTLRWLELRGLRLTDRQKSALRSALPRCELLEK